LPPTPAPSLLLAGWAVRTIDASEARTAVDAAMQAVDAAR
jgi:hypothetical protein